MGDALEGMTVSLTDQAPRIEGQLVDAGGAAVTRYSIVVFPADRTLWTPDSRRVRMTQPATDGTFAVSGLPPGDYAIAAADNIEASDLADASVLTELLLSAYKVSLTNGQQLRQQLSLPR